MDIGKKRKARKEKSPSSRRKTSREKLLKILENFLLNGLVQGFQGYFSCLKIIKEL